MKSWLRWRKSTAMLEYSRTIVILIWDCGTYYSWKYAYSLTQRIFYSGQLFQKGEWFFWSPWEKPWINSQIFTALTAVYFSQLLWFESLFTRVRCFTPQKHVLLQNPYRTWPTNKNASRFQSMSHIGLFKSHELIISKPQSTIFLVMKLVPV